MIHILPINDIKPHTEDSTCKCNPKIETIEDTGELMCVHNSFDGREFVEELIEGVNSEAKQN